MADSFPARPVELGRVWAGQLNNFFFAVRSQSKPTLIIDDKTRVEMRRVGGTDLWYAAPSIDALGRLHSFHYEIDGKPFGGSVNVPAFTKLSYPMPGFKQGTLSPKKTVVSKLYDGMTTDYWVYTPPGYDPKTPCAVMVFLDGGLMLSRENGSKITNVLDNLIQLKQSPYMLAVFVDPGKISPEPLTATYERAKSDADKWHRSLNDSMRSILFDTVGDKYPHFLRDELLVAVAREYNLRQDDYSRAIAGFSSGGNCSLNAAWELPEAFTRVLSGIGSYTSIGWSEPPNAQEGAQDYPDKILREAHRNIRVWLQDGSDDLEIVPFGSWPLGNIRVANALKLAGYDFHFSFGEGGHGPEQVEAEFPEVLTWLWRDYDSARKGQTFEMEAAEKVKPVFRVRIFNRDAN